MKFNSQIARLNKSQQKFLQGVFALAEIGLADVDTSRTGYNKKTNQIAVFKNNGEILLKLKIRSKKMTNYEEKLTPENVAKVLNNYTGFDGQIIKRCGLYWYCNKDKNPSFYSTGESLKELIKSTVFLYKK